MAEFSRGQSCKPDGEEMFCFVLSWGHTQWDSQLCAPGGTPGGLGIRPELATCQPSGLCSPR